MNEPRLRRACLSTAPSGQADGRQVLAITAGDPCGVGPEVILKALAPPFCLESSRVGADESLTVKRLHRLHVGRLIEKRAGRAVAAPPSCPLIVIGDLAVFERTATRLRRRLPRWRIASPQPHSLAPPAPLTFIDLAHRGRFEPGKPTRQAGKASIEYLDVAIALAKRGALGALVTGPLTKASVEPWRRGFQGHTEYLARAFGVPEPVMMFVSPTLRVVLLTRHLALRDVPRRVTSASLRHAIRVTTDGLRRRFGIPRPRLAICGLNPHASEGGLFGREERRVLAPVLRACQRDGIHLEGPFSADGFFVDAGGYDAVLCWYHDQGLIPFKMRARDQGCQLTLGLPIIRTSPVHGSALDIAGKGVAHPGSMRYAIQLAATLVSKTTRV